LDFRKRYKEARIRKWPLKARWIGVRCKKKGVETNKQDAARTIDVLLVNIFTINAANND
jgi:hypothetical protein